MKNLFLFVLLSTAFSCASAPEPKVTESQNTPEWVAHPEAKFPNNRYLVSVGSGSTREESIQDARKQMAESFLVKVQSYTKVNSQSSMTENTDGHSTGDASQNMTKDVSLETSTHLRGAEVKETTKVGATFYALLALDKLNARSGLLMEANRLGSKLNASLDALEENFTQTKLEEAKADLSKFQELYAEAAALGMSSLVDLNPAQSRLNRLENKIRAKNQKLNFSVKTLKGENYFERDVQACINDRGGTVFDAEKNPTDTHQVQITVVERPQHMPVEGWTKIRFDLTAAIVQPNGKMVRVQTSQTESGRSRSAVLEAVSDRLSKELCDQLFNRIGEMKE